MFLIFTPGWKSAQALVCVAIMACLWGCNSNESTQSSTTPMTEQDPLSELSIEQQAQKKLAIDAKDKLFESLSGELMKSMGEKGPAKSIAVCKTRAPEIAEFVSNQTGVRIGRTSFKLRNDLNRPPKWAVSFVSKQIETPIEVELPDDGLGVLLPIRLQSACTLCHGTEKQVLPEVKAAIIANYPQDDATGFSEGDVRGYFWIEVPKQRD